MKCNDREERGKRRDLTRKRRCEGNEGRERREGREWISQLSVLDQNEKVK